MDITNRQWEITVNRTLGDQWADVRDGEGRKFRPDTVSVALEALDGTSVPRLLPVTVYGVLIQDGAAEGQGPGRAMVDVQPGEKMPPWVAKAVEAAVISVGLRDGGDDDSGR
jgi:hypothetical protein